MMFTDRELACLELIAQGMSNDRIVRKLDLSAGTATRAISSLYRKLGAVDRASAVAIAFRRGLLA